MTSLEDRFTQLLEGDIVHLETTTLSIRAEVESRKRVRYQNGAEEHTVEFMPVGAAARSVPADRYRVTVERDSEGRWSVGELTAAIFDEETVAYRTHHRGEITRIQRLERRD